MRSYETTGGDGAISLPEGYDGTMLSPKPPPSVPSAEPPATVAKEVKYSPASTGEDAESAGAIPVENRQKPSPFGLPNLLSLFSKMPAFPSLKGIFSSRKEEGGEGGENRFGIEEILLVAVAAFLFFSKEGDRECALFLLLLLLL